MPTIKMTMKEIEARGGSRPNPPFYLLHEKCGMISTFYAMFTGQMPACFHCGQGNDFQVVEVIEET